MNNICLATNYLLMTESTRRMWIDLGRHLEEFDSRLVLMSTVLPETPLPFPVIPIPFLLRDYASLFPRAGGKGGNMSAQDMEFLETDSIRSNHAYPPGEAIKGMFACRELLTTLRDTLQPGYVLTFDPTLPSAQILQSLARESGVPVQGIERGLLPETLMVESRNLQGYSDLRTHWLAQEMPSSASDPAAYERIRSYYVSRKPQKYDQPGFGGGGALRRSLGLEGKKVIVFLGHYDACGLVPKNSNQRRYNSPFFDSTADALTAVGDILARNRGVAVVFKPHPLDVHSYSVAKVQGIQIVRDVNVHALIELADVVAAQFTTLQYEAVFYEKPIVLLGHSAWWGRNAAYEADRCEDVPAALNAALNRRDWNIRQANAHAFVTWMMDRFLIGCSENVPARRKLRDLAEFIARTSLDNRHLPASEDRWRRAAQTLDALKTKSATNPGNGGTTGPASSCLETKDESDLSLPAVEKDPVLKNSPHPCSLTSLGENGGAKPGHL
jgi:hypothetical protein